MTLEQIQIAAIKSAEASLNALAIPVRYSRIQLIAEIIEAEFLPFAEDNPVDPLQIRQTSVPVNKVEL